MFEQLSVDATDPDWAARLRAVARDFPRLALAHPRVEPPLVTHPLGTPLGLRPAAVVRPLQAILELLTAEHFSNTADRSPIDSGEPDPE
ncbi:hypothetical protein OHB26_03960 [Nocardia sp. NBC_01503]|uniref:hypothetical protein n=1 Tax=Nocardia sp. NBC_01503 TaxID=2975997 RepID=UPI002E7BBBBB|nr:hypothetical protein [Nocardia sp. NBC_01503]WTL33407.1 hypothetical protein OHB26_03960 [Nocardia sp. NBC_01503]